MRADPAGAMTHEPGACRLTFYWGEKKPEDSGSPPSASRPARRPRGPPPPPLAQARLRPLCLTVLA
eukprot:1227533-Prymnesium_polylepis.1